MKKLLSTLSMLTVLMSATLFTSCDEIFIEDEAMVLSGEWNGDFGMFYFDNRGYRWDSYDTEIVFYPDYNGASHGYGYQQDWYERGPYRYLSYRFTWEIHRRDIYLHYPSDPNLDVVIYDYTLSNNYFSGFFGDSSNRFKLRKVVDYYNWGPYYTMDYYADPFPNYPYYGKTRGNVTEESIPSQEEIKVVRRGNRFNEQK